MLNNIITKVHYKSYKVGELNIFFLPKKFSLTSDTLSAEMERVTYSNLAKLIAQPDGHQDYAWRRAKFDDTVVGREDIIASAIFSELCGLCGTLMDKPRKLCTWNPPRVGVRLIHNTSDDIVHLKSYAWCKLGILGPEVTNETYRVLPSRLSPINDALVMSTSSYWPEGLLNLKPNYRISHKMRL